MDTPSKGRKSKILHKGSTKKITVKKTKTIDKEGVTSND